MVEPLTASPDHSGPSQHDYLTLEVFPKKGETPQGPCRYMVYTSARRGYHITIVVLELEPCRGPGPY